MKNIGRAFYLLWNTSKFTLSGVIFLYILLSLFPSLNLILINKIVNSVTALLASNAEGYQSIFPLILIQLLVTASHMTLRNVKSILTTQLEYKVEYYTEKNMMNNVKNIPYELYEQSEFYNHMSRVVNGNVANKIITPVNGVLSISSSIITLSTIIILLLNIHYTLVIMSVLSFIPFLLINTMFGKKTYTLMKFQTPFFRKINYLKSLMYSKNSIKEIRLYNLYEYLFNKWDKYYIKNMNEALSLKVKQELYNSMLDIIKGILYAFSSVILIFLIIKKNAKIGDFVMGIQAIDQVQNQVSNIAREIANVFSSKYYLDDFFNFYDLLKKEHNSSEEKEKVKINCIKKIEFINATYTYPDSERIVLDNISLTISEEESIALVGENGSGKTTLIHCLMGLYPLTTGKVEVNGISIDDIDLEEFRSNFTVIFQDFIKYAFSVKENIIMSDLKAQEGNRYEMALFNSGVENFVEKLPNCDETILGKIFEKGEDLSGGQWQKIAIARSIYRNSDILILDEPTSSLDPKSESFIFNQYEKLTQGKISVFISHRLIFTKNVGKIVVLKDGRIAEIGSHEKLMNNRNEYYEMYTIQSKLYKEEIAIH
ncbi:ABC transporter ATP-binding protein [Peribacillus frigoritolerans]|uniref:ABC transporter ATP-binding protein n=1 Tax=Peribacillus frigoritolerans TaxID=450367 RepID=UPI003F7E2659